MMNECDRFEKGGKGLGSVRVGFLGSGVPGRLHHTLFYFDIFYFFIIMPASLNIIKRYQCIVASSIG